MAFAGLMARALQKTFAARFALALLLAALTAVPAGATTVSTLEVVDPIFKSYAFGVEQTTFQFSVPGDVTADLYFVGDGNEASDFVGLPAGAVALIVRGGENFSIKVENAWIGGASAAIIYDHLIEPIFQGSYGGGSPVIPSLFVTNQVGLELLSLLQAGPVSVHIEISSVAEPGAGLVLALGVMGLLSARSRASWRTVRLGAS